MIALTVESDDARAVALLTVTGAVGAVTITATPLAYRTAYTVRQTGTGTPDPLVISDYEVPLNVVVSYTVKDSTNAVATAVLTDPVDPGGPWLSSTFTPTNGGPVVVTDDAPHTLAARSAWFDVIGRRDPLVAVDVMRYRSGLLSFYAGNYAARGLLVGLFTPGDPLLLRTPCHEVVDDVIFLPLSATEEPLVDNYGGRRYAVEYQAVTRTLGSYTGRTGWTYTDVATDYADYVEVRDTFDTYALLELGPPDVVAAAPPATAWSIVL